MSAFEVQCAPLHHVGHTLAEVGDLLGGASTAALREGVATLGSARLEAALHEFARRWGHGVRQLADASATAGRQVTEAARCYDNVEARLAQAIEGSS